MDHFSMHGVIINTIHYPHISVYNIVVASAHALVTTATPAVHLARVMLVCELLALGVYWWG